MLRLITCCVLLLASGLVGAAEANEPTCPTLDDANTRLQERAEDLLKKLEGSIRSEEAKPDLWVSLTNVIVARAKEEARLWLVQKVSKEICAADKSSRHYFPNTCELVGAMDPFPGASLNVLRTRLRRDVYALPACYGYRQLGQSAPADAIDAYLLEALLVAVYRHWKKDTELENNAPTLNGLPDKMTIAKLLAGVIAMHLPESSPTGGTCTRPSMEDLGRAVVAIERRLEGTGGVSNSPEAVFTELVKHLRVWCPEQAETLRKLNDAYMTAVRGDYFETTFAAASAFLCNKQPQPLEICSRLPLIAELSDAKTSAEIESALDRLIAPVGAWRRKQSEPLWSLNAMAGVGIGKEQLSDRGDEADHFTSGLYVPIAVEYSWPAKPSRSTKQGWFGAYAVGLTAADLGGLVSYSKRSKLSGGETSSSSNSSWSSITAPGVYLAAAFRDSPFRIGLSISRTPELRSINFDDGVERGVDSTRALLFVTVDVTLLGF